MTFERAGDLAGRDIDADVAADADPDDGVAPHDVAAPAHAGVAARGRQPGRAAAAHHPPHSAILAALANHSGMNELFSHEFVLPCRCHSSVIHID